MGQIVERRCNIYLTIKTCAFISKAFLSVWNVFPAAGHANVRGGGDSARLQSDVSVCFDVFNESINY